MHPVPSLLPDRTYASACHLSVAGCLRSLRNSSLGLSYPGECCSLSPCPHSYSPVCDSRGVTHPNQCTFAFEQCLHQRVGNGSLALAYRGPCCQTECQAERQEEPVCDNQGHTHASECQFKWDSGHLMRSAECASARHRDSASRI